VRASSELFQRERTASRKYETNARAEQGEWVLISHRPGKAILEVDHQNCDSHVDSVQSSGDSRPQSRNEKKPANKLNQSDNHGSDCRKRNSSMTEESRDAVNPHLEQLLIAMNKKYDSGHDA